MSSAPVSLIDSDVVIRVSSTLDKSVGKKYLTDGSNETCWTSANGLPQSITLAFPSPVLPSQLALTFAGGFVGTHCALACVLPPAPDAPEGGRKEWTVVHRFYPADSNRKQEFALDLSATAAAAAGGADGAEAAGRGSREWRIEFEKGSDFFGRITLYDLQIYGWRV